MALWLVSSPELAPESSPAVTIVSSNNLGPNLTRGKYLPIVAVPELRELVSVQDVRGPDVAKVRYITLGQPKLGKALQSVLRVGVMLAEILRRRPQLVMGIYMMPHGLIAFGLARLTGIPVCIHVIGGPKEIMCGGYGLDQWQVPWPSKRLEALYLGILRRADMVMVVGSNTKRYLVIQGVPAERVHLMSSKIDPHRFRPYPDTAKPYDLILTAQLAARKRVDLFLQIVAGLQCRYPAIRAAVLGDGPLRQELEALAGRLKLGEHVDFLGFHEDTERFYNQARVFVLTSSAEGLSLAMLEAMACGLPAVVPDVGDLGDVVRDGETGYLIADGDREAFVRVIGDLLDRDHLRCQLGQNARSAILDGYTVDAGARQWQRVLHQLASGPPRAVGGV